MKRAAEIIVRPTPDGLLVCAPGYLGSCKYSAAGELLTPRDLLVLARMAAQQGARLVVEIQGDGGSLYPLMLPDEWEGAA